MAAHQRFSHPITADRSRTTAPTPAQDRTGFAAGRTAGLPLLGTIAATALAMLAAVALAAGSVDGGVIAPASVVPAVTVGLLGLALAGLRQRHAERERKERSERRTPLDRTRRPGAAAGRPLA